MTKNRLDVWVGLFVSLGLAAVLFLALATANLSQGLSGLFGRSSAYSITASFDNIGSLKERAPVKSAGYVVGRVEHIRFDTQRYEAVVTLRIDGDYQFPVDSWFKIQTAGLLGEQYIAIQPGGDDKDIAPGEAVKYRQSAIILEDMISKFLFDKAADGPKKGE